MVVAMLLASPFMAGVPEKWTASQAVSGCSSQRRHGGKHDRRGRISVAVARPVHVDCRETIPFRSLSLIPQSLTRPMIHALAGAPDSDGPALVVVPATVINDLS